MTNFMTKLVYLIVLPKELPLPKWYLFPVVLLVLWFDSEPLCCVGVNSVLIDKIGKIILIMAVRGVHNAITYLNIFFMAALKSNEKQCCLLRRQRCFCLK